MPPCWQSGSGGWGPLLTYTLPTWGLRRSIFWGGRVAEPCDAAVALGMPRHLFQGCVILISLAAAGVWIHSPNPPRANPFARRPAKVIRPRPAKPSAQHSKSLPLFYYPLSPLSSLASASPRLCVRPLTARCVAESPTQWLRVPCRTRTARAAVPHAARNPARSPLGARGSPIHRRDVARRQHPARHEHLRRHPAADHAQDQQHRPRPPPTADSVLPITDSIMVRPTELTAMHRMPHRQHGRVREPHAESEMSDPSSMHTTPTHATKHAKPVPGENLHS